MCDEHRSENQTVTESEEKDAKKQAADELLCTRLHLKMSKENNCRGNALQLNYKCLYYCYFLIMLNVLLALFSFLQYKNQ